MAQSMRRLHPLRLQYEVFASPLWGPLQPAIASAQENREPVSSANALWQLQELYSSWTETWLNAYRDLRDQICEASFDAIYGSPFLQALVGLRGSDESGRRHTESAAHSELVAQRIKKLKDSISRGGPREAAIRALLYVRMPEGAVDERGFNFLRRMRDEAGEGLPLSDFKRLVREQFFMLLIDERRALEAIPAMLAKDPVLAHRMRAMLRRLIETLGLQSQESKARLAELRRLIEQTNGSSPKQPLAKLRPLPARVAKGEGRSGKADNTKRH
jgi:hypothetical protein